MSGMWWLWLVKEKVLQRQLKSKCFVLCFCVTWKNEKPAQAKILEFY